MSDFDEIIKKVFGEKTNQDSYLDEDGQPPNQINRRMRFDRNTRELMGICRGVVADNILNDDEIKMLCTYLAANREIFNEWPANVIVNRVKSIINDGVIDDQERRELFSLLSDAVGSGITSDGARLSTTLPLDMPAPEVVFSERTFCFTGKTALGAREKCEEEVIKRGGRIHKSVVLALDYLVIGVVASRDWAHTSFGRKIQTAVDYKNKGSKVQIVSEEHWAKFL